MRIYTALIILCISSIGLMAFLSFQVSDRNIYMLSTVVAYIISIMMTFFITKRESDKNTDFKLHGLKEEFNNKIRKLKKEHDTAMLEKTIREGTRTLIKNALDYFKIENIKNEMGPSAAIQNLQLDKYGQIIELLADFSLILPDYQENQEIVQQEINHQIDIYQIDEKPFVLFLERLMEKYIITVNKKIREKTEQKTMKTCPHCAERVLTSARVCKHCGHALNNIPKPMRNSAEWIKKGSALCHSGKYAEAISAMTNAIELDPKSAKAYYNRAIVYKKLDRQIQATDDLKAAAKFGHTKAREILNQQQLMDTQEWKEKSAYPK